MGVKSIQLTSKSHHENILASLHQLRLQGQLSDVTVQVDYQGEVQEFQAHQVVLAASSGYFRKILLSQDAHRDKLLLSNMHSNDFSKFLEFAYTGMVEVARDKIGDVEAAAQLLDCADLTEVCGEAMSAGVLQKPTKKTSVSDVADKDDLQGSKREKRAKGKKQPEDSFLKRKLSSQTPEKEVVSKRFKAKDTLRDEKRPGGQVKQRLAGRKVLQRHVKSKREALNNENQVTNENTEEHEDGTEAEPRPENQAEKGDESSLGMPGSDMDDWECEDNVQSKDPEDPSLLSPEEEEEGEGEGEEEGEEEHSKASKRTSKAQFQCNKCQRTFHYERSYLKHIR